LMFDRVGPEEVRDILLLRRNHPDDYKSLLWPVRLKA
jgi:hypothetical protein